MSCSGRGATYIEWDVAVPTIHLANGKTSISSHGSMDHAVSQQCAIDVIRSIAWDGTYHVRWICSRITASEIFDASNSCRKASMIPEKITDLCTSD